MSIFDKMLDAFNLSDEDDMDDDYYDDEEEETDKTLHFRKKEEADEPRPVRKRTQSSGNKITPIRSRKTQGGDGMEVCVIKPSAYEDVKDITDTLLDNRTVILNMEGLDMAVAQRIIDFVSGACYALEGSLQKVSNFIFVVTPASVDISGDMQDILNGIDMSGIKTSDFSQ